MLQALSCPCTITFFVADCISDLPQQHDCCFYVSPFYFPELRRSLRPVGVRLQVPSGVAVVSLWNGGKVRRHSSPSI